MVHMATSSYLWNRMKGFSQAGPKNGGTGQGFIIVKVPNGTTAQAAKDMVHMATSNYLWNRVFP